VDWTDTYLTFIQFFFFPYSSYLELVLSLYFIWEWYLAAPTSTHHSTSLHQFYFFIFFNFFIIIFFFLLFCFWQ
jgi:hypothetical protein